MPNAKPAAERFSRPQRMLLGALAPLAPRAPLAPLAACADDSHSLRLDVSPLRQKLEDDPTQPRHILTATGVGSRLVN